MDSQKGRLIVGGVILVVLAGLMLWLYSDDLFTRGVTTPAQSAAAANRVETGGDAGSDAAAPPGRAGGRMVAPDR